jgi:hypothetical protein
MAAPAVFPCGGYSSGWARASLIILRNCLLGLGRAGAVVESACTGRSPVAAANGMAGPTNSPTAATVPTEAPATVLAIFPEDMLTPGSTGRRQVWRTEGGEWLPTV